MSAARFTAVLETGITDGPDMDPTAVNQASVASCTMVGKAIPAVPSRYYVWVYDISVVKSAVIA